MISVEHLFMCLLAIRMSSLEKCVFWKLILCQLFHLLLFSPIPRAGFSPYSFPRCEKAFKNALNLLGK